MCRTSSTDVEDWQAECNVQVLTLFFFLLIICDDDDDDDECNVQVVALSELLDELKVKEEEVRDNHFGALRWRGTSWARCVGFTFRVIALDSC